MRENFLYQTYLENPNKTIVTRAGNSAHIVHVEDDANTGGKSIVGIVEETTGKVAKIYDDHGRISASSESDYDLFFEAVEKSGYVNLYRNESGEIFAVYYAEKITAQQAREQGKYAFLMSTPIRWEE